MQTPHDELHLADHMMVRYSCLTSCMVETSFAWTYGIGNLPLTSIVQSTACAAAAGSVGDAKGLHSKEADLEEGDVSEATALEHEDDEYDHGEHDEDLEMLMRPEVDVFDADDPHPSVATRALSGLQNASRPRLSLSTLLNPSLLPQCRLVGTGRSVGSLDPTAQKVRTLSQIGTSCASTQYQRL